MENTIFVIGNLFLLKFAESRPESRPPSWYASLFPLCLAVSSPWHQDNLHQIDDLSHPAQEAIPPYFVLCPEQVWDVSRQVAEHTLRHHRGKVQAVAWNPAESPVLLTGAFDKTACLVREFAMVAVMIGECI